MVFSEIFVGTILIPSLTYIDLVIDGQSKQLILHLPADTINANKGVLDSQIFLDQDTSNIALKYDLHY